MPYKESPYTSLRYRSGERGGGRKSVGFLTLFFSSCIQYGPKTEGLNKMNYKETMEYLEEMNYLGSVPGLESITELCRRLDNPQDKLKFVHIAGTNGKGSVLAYISTVLKMAGYRVGRYLSPTISSYRERIQVNNVSILARELAEVMCRVR